MRKRWHSTVVEWSKLKDVARRHRSNPTPSEAVLWEHLRDRQLHGVKFRRQHAIGRFLVDFYARESKLVVEVDGRVHADQQERDEERTAYIESLGLCVLRFSSEEIHHDIESVLQRIGAHIRARENARPGASAPPTARSTERSDHPRDREC